MHPSDVWQPQFTRNYCTCQHQAPSVCASVCVCECAFLWRSDKDSGSDEPKERSQVPDREGAESENGHHEDETGLPDHDETDQADGGPSAQGVIPSMWPLRSYFGCGPVGP